VARGRFSNLGRSATPCFLSAEDSFLNRESCAQELRLMDPMVGGYGKPKMLCRLRKSWYLESETPISPRCVFLSYLAAKSNVDSEKAWYTVHFFTLGARARDLYQHWPSPISRVVTRPGL
jgi:hypothetical protein